MCGIAGFINTDLSPDSVNRMIGNMKHRGPDDEGTYFDPVKSLGLGQVRLSIIDLSQGGHQPMISRDGTIVIVFNGEIYNFKDVKSRLINKGRAFRTSSDTEVIILAYQEWGIDCLQYLDGMFAFALYDHQHDQMLLARDRFGEKPLYYIQKEGGKLIFASEIRALLKSGYPAIINKEVLPEFLASQTVHPPFTLIKGISFLESGHYLLVKNHRIEKKAYWSPKANAVECSLEEAKGKVRELFLDSVQNRLVSDVPVGAFLSGGIDSTIMVGAAASLMSNKFNTYTIAFDDREFKDGHYAKIAADYFRTSHYEVKLGMQEVLDEIPDALRAIDHPSADGVNSYLISRAVSRQGLKVALSGLGGDEIFGGYSSFRQLSNISEMRILMKLVPKFLREGIASIFLNDHTRTGKIKMAEFMRSGLTLSQNYLLTRQFFFDFQIDKLIPSGALHATNQTVHTAGLPGEYSYSEISILELNHYMHDVLLRDTDQMSMANSLEVRTPFLDYKLVEFVLGLKNSFKFEGKINKSLFVNSLREYIPDALIHRPKQGFSMPFSRWMLNELKTFCTSRLEYLKGTKLLAPEAIDFYWQCFQNKKENVNWARLWLLISLSYWMELNNVAVEGR